MADKTRYNFITDIMVPYGDIASAVFVDLFDFGEKYMFRGFSTYSELDQDVILRFDNAGINSDFDTWDDTITYKPGFFVKGSDYNAYQSIQGGNLNHDPVSEPTWWKPFSQEMIIPPRWEVSPGEKFLHNGVLQIKHASVAPISGFLKIISWRAE